MWGFGDYTRIDKNNRWVPVEESILIKLPFWSVQHRECRTRSIGRSSRRKDRHLNLEQVRSSFSSIDSLAAPNADNEIRLGLQAHFRETIDLLSRGFATKEDVCDFEIGFLQCFYELLAG